jgi:heme/copper-type cytochrome/quinol oxidase subunit 4
MKEEKPDKRKLFDKIEKEKLEIKYYVLAFFVSILLILPIYLIVRFLPENFILPLFLYLLAIFYLLFLLNIH